MAIYEFTAKDENGSVFEGARDNISSVAVLRQELGKTGGRLIKAKRIRPGPTRHAKIPQSEIVTFAYKLAGMCSAGLSVTRCLGTLAEQTTHLAFKKVLTDIEQSIATGATLTVAFGKYRHIFSDFFLGMLEAGESSGQLSQSLEISANYLENQADFKRKLKAAFSYPIVVGIMAFIVVTCVIIFIIPVFSKLNKQMHVSLPVPTQIIISFSNIVRNWSWVIAVLVVVTVLLLKIFSRKTSLKARWDVFKLNMPVFAKLNRTIVVSHFIRTFAMLTKTGVSMIRALEIAAQVVHNQKISQIIGRSRQFCRSFFTKL